MGCDTSITRVSWEGQQFVNYGVRLDGACNLITAWSDPACLLDSGAIEITGAGVVANVADDDVLNVRAGPGPGYWFLFELAPGASVQLTGVSAIAQDGGVWILIAANAPRFGWVNSRFIEASA
jgi:uncharacterized protein YgiM (DUF1202 family)